MTEKVLSLKQIQGKLQTKAHVLIHLCEKGVIEPDLQKTEGRGIRREFSERNLFEFAVALTIRKYGIPVATTAAVIRLLRSFERFTRDRVRGFTLLSYLSQQDENSTILVFIYDGEYIVFGVAKAGKLVVITGFDITKLISAYDRQIKFDHLQSLPVHFSSYLKLDLKELAHHHLD